MCPSVRSSFRPKFRYDFERIDILSFKGELSRGEHGEQHVLIMVDVFSHFLIAVPLTDRRMDTVCSAVIHRLFVPWGAPRRIVADREFSAADFAALLTLLETNAACVSAYHSSSNPAERYCQVVQQALRTMLCEFPSVSHGATWLGEWVDYLPFIVAAHNSAPYSSSGVTDSAVSPFEIVTGRRHRWPQDLGFIDDPSHIPPATSLAEYWATKREHMAAVTKWVRRIVDEQRAKNKGLHDQHQKFIDLAMGEQVIVRVPTRKGKPVPQYIGPCAVIEKESDLIYVVKHGATGREYRVHVDRLRRHTPLEKLSGDEPVARSDTSSSPTPLVGRRVAKTFEDGKLYKGTVIRWTTEHGNLTYKVLCEYNTLIDDVLPEPVINEIIKPGSEHVVIMRGKRDFLASAVQRQRHKDEARNGPAAMAVDTGGNSTERGRRVSFANTDDGAAMEQDEAPPARDQSLIDSVQLLLNASHGSIPSTVKAYAITANISQGDAQECVAWAVRNGVDLSDV